MDGIECPHCLTQFKPRQVDYYLDLPIMCPWCGFEPSEDEQYAAGNYTGKSSNNREGK